MAYEFKKLSEVEVLTEVPEGASVLAEVNGDIKRVPGDGLGGAGGYVIKLANSYVDDNGMFCFEESYDELYDVLVAGGSVWVDYTNAPEVNESSVLASSASSGLYSATNRGSTQCSIVMWAITDVGLGLMDTMGMMSGDLNIYYPNGSHNLEPVVIEK